MLVQQEPRSLSKNERIERKHNESNICSQLALKKLAQLYCSIQRLSAQEIENLGLTKKEVFYTKLLSARVCVHCGRNDGLLLKCHHPNCEKYIHPVCGFEFDSASPFFTVLIRTEETNFLSVKTRKKNEQLFSGEKPWEFENRCEAVHYCAEHLSPALYSSVVGFSCAICNMGDLHGLKLFGCLQCGAKLHKICYDPNSPDNWDEGFTCDSCRFGVFEISACKICSEQEPVMRLLSFDGLLVSFCIYCFFVMRNYSLWSFFSKLTKTFSMERDICSLCRKTDSSLKLKCESESVECSNKVHLRCQKALDRRLRPAIWDHYLVEKKMVRDFNFCCEKHFYQTVLHCVCKEFISDENVEKTLAVECSECGNRFHQGCLQIVDSDMKFFAECNFICSRCMNLKYT